MGLLNGNIPNQNTPNSLPPQLRQNIQQVKNMMKMFNGDINAMAQQNPMINQVMQMCQGQSPEQFFKTLCKRQGFDFEAIIKELQN